MRKLIVLPMLIALMILLDGCKGEECGCEAETKFNISSEVGLMFVDENQDYAYITTETVLGRFELCFPENYVDEYRQYEQPVRVLFSGEAKDDCIKLYYQYYYYYYNIILTDIEKID